MIKNGTWNGDDVNCGNTNLNEKMWSSSGNWSQYLKQLQINLKRFQKKDKKNN